MNTTNEKFVEAISHNDDSEQVEMVYDPKQKKSSFARLRDGKVEYLDQITLPSGQTIRPWSSTNSLISYGFIKLPSVAEDYDRERNLYEETLGFVNSHVALPRSFASVSALYAMMSWLYDGFHALPYLRVIGASGTGKTTFLQTVGNLCYKGMFASGSTSLAALFRTIDHVQGTFVFDEADFRASEMSNDITKVLNSGYQAEFPVLRMEVDPRNDKILRERAFNIFGPKVIASRARFHDEALETRCLTQIMPIRSKLKTPLVQPATFDSQALSLRNKLLTFRFRHMHDNFRAEHELKGIEVPRLKQILAPLMHVSQMVGADVQLELIKYAQALEADMKQELLRSPEADVLMCLLVLIQENKSHGEDKIHIQQVADEFNRRYIRDYRGDPLPDVQNERDLVRQGYYISAKKAGTIIARKLMIKTKQDGHGYYIPPAEHKRIAQLGERYGITEDMITNS